MYWGGKVNQSQISFDVDQVEAWFNYNKTVTEGIDFNTAEDCLMHIGNLDQIWEWGINFDEGTDQDGLEKITKRLKLENVTQTKVVWSWLKYLAH